MIRTLARTTATALVLAACATASKPDVEVSSQPQPQPAQTTGMGTQQTAPAASTAFDPLGSYTFSVITQGNTIGGTMNIRKAPDGSLGGDMASDQGSLTFTSVTVDGRRVTTTGVLDNGPELTFVMDFVGDEFTGSISAQGQSVGSISGSRKKS